MTGIVSFDFPIIALAIFGFVYIVRYLDGPLDIFERTRRYIGISIHEIVMHVDGKMVSEVDEHVKDTFFAKLVACFWCFSTWISIIVSTVYCVVHQRDLLDWFVLTFACVAVAGVLHDLLET